MKVQQLREQFSLDPRILERRISNAQVGTWMVFFIGFCEKSTSYEMLASSGDARLSHLLLRLVDLYT